jgi:hypothetical protein
MKIKIKSTMGKVLVSGRYESLKDAAEKNKLNLRGADLRGVDLQGANLWMADLREADFCGDDLREADFCGADLRGADLRRTDLREADFRGANLRTTNLQGVDLRGAKLQNADLFGADLDFSVWPLRCGSLSAKIDDRIITQLLYHAAMPAQNNDIVTDPDIEKLFNSKLFKKVVNKFHRVQECGKFEGVK